MRIVSQPRYPNAIPPAHAVELLAQACATAHHEFWLCDISVLDPELIERRRIHGGRQVTDTYLLALAARHDGRLATFDRSVPRSAVPVATADDLVVL